MKLDWQNLEPEVHKHLSPHSHVYLLASPGEKEVKIGQTGGCVFARRATLRTQLGRSIFVMAILHARPTLETLLHRRFAYLHLHDEWFEHAPELDALARRFNALDREVFGTRPGHPDEIELQPWC